VNTHPIAARPTVNTVESSVFISADFLMTKESEQYNNRRWFKDMLQRPVSQATGYPPKSFASSLTDKSKLSRKRFFQLSGIELKDMMHFWYDENAISIESLRYLNRFLPKGSILIGYELGEPTRKVLDRAGIRYVDIWLHPIRFYEDVLFGFSSGTRSVYEGLKKFHLSDENFWLYADRLRIQLYKGWRRDERDLTPGSALLVGQTLEDKALCRGGKMLSLFDFKQEVETLTSEYAKVYYSRHPFVKKGDEAVLDWLATFKNIEFASDPAYHLIANPAIKKVAALSSSVVHEARFFGKKTEFFYKPIFTLGKRFGHDYLTVYQEFVSAHFWADALRSIYPVRECSRIGYADSKDKLRDMLAFYWNWSSLDKTESMRQKLNAVAGKVHKTSKPPSTTERLAGSSGSAIVPRPTRGQSDKQFIRSARVAFAKASLITFDVFDTLIERPFENYENVFALIAPQAFQLTGLPAEVFVEMRQRARAFAEARRVNEEVPLLMRYAALCEKAGVPKEHAQVLADYEFETDLSLMQPRKMGAALFELALTMGKRVALISDIYYTSEQVALMLERCGIRGFERLFTSCEVGKLKHSGTLFAVVQETMKVAADNIVHVGDNEHSDVKMAQAAGWTAFHLKSAGDAFKDRSKLSHALKHAHAPTQSLLRGLISHKFHDNPKAGLIPTWCEGDAYRFGYSLAGPIFWGFAQWVLKRAMADGVSHLYFLARDGDIVKQMYDRIAAEVPGAPSAHYLLASRRSVNVASLKTVEDAIKLLKVNFTPCPIGRLLQVRFGVEPSRISSADLAAGEYETANSMANFQLHQSRLEAVVRSLWPVIAENSAEEWIALEAYYRREGLFDSPRAAIVDIGHNGTMQQSLARMTQTSLPGYYFVTYSGIAEIEKNGLSAKGYLAEHLDGKTTSHPYCARLLMFELLFLNDTGSFVKFTRQGGQLIPVHLPLDKEQGRVAFIREVYRGAVDLAVDLASSGHDPVTEIRFTPDELVAPYLAMLADPSQAEARMMEGLCFENVYSGRDERYILAPAGVDTESIWLEGRDASRGTTGNSRPWFHTVFEHAVRRCTSEVKLRKYRQDPRRFFLESRHSLVRALAVIAPREASQS
jgi:FMN phosphatase YigB (HAD superfamily)